MKNLSIIVSDYWYGVVWLPEFWLTVALGGGLVWSVSQDRKIAIAPAARRV